jgi:hexaprenyl-diphosphate synthase
MLDFAVSDASFGKPSGGADLRLGLATAPTLYAWEEFEEMGPLIQRRFEKEGDVELVSYLSVYSQFSVTNCAVGPSNRWSLTRSCPNQRVG